MKSALLLNYLKTIDIRSHSTHFTIYYTLLTNDSNSSFFFVGIASRAPIPVIQTKRKTTYDTTKQTSWRRQSSVTQFSKRSLASADKRLSSFLLIFLSFEKPIELTADQRECPYFQFVLLSCASFSASSLLFFLISRR